MKVLYLSYDGMTDPLGQSQVIPYLTGLSQKGHQFTLISFEKNISSRKNKYLVRKILKSNQICWVPLPYHKNPPVLSTLYDLYLLKRTVCRLHSKYQFQVIHCRSYLTALVGVQMKLAYGIKLIFDMRGFWPDEKLDSGYWKYPIYTPIYRYFKRLEKKLFNQSDITISLTKVGKDKIVKKYGISSNKVKIIPTCVNFEVFREFDNVIRTRIRNELNIPQEVPVLIYSGSIGGNYPVSDIISAFLAFRNVYPRGYLLVLSKNTTNELTNVIKQYHPDTLSFVKLCSASPNEVGGYIMSADVGLIFYKDGISNLGRSPTKLGEYWACGVPAISTKDIGDLNLIEKKYPNALFLTDTLFQHQQLMESYKLAIDRKNILQMRKYASEYFNLSKGVEKYHQIYNQLKED